MREATLQLTTRDPEPPRVFAHGRFHPVWQRAFRPFFLGTSVYAAVLVPAWIAIWRGALPAPDWLTPASWHAHEMLFGMVVAAIAGFLLTAAPIWTGRPTLCGRPLMALFALWTLGRVAMLGAGHLPATLVAAIDVAFLPLVACVLAQTVWRTGQHRNYAVVCLVGGLALANAAVHAQALGVAAGSASPALRFTVDMVVVLIVVIGGRITPVFTANALLRGGIPAHVSSHPWLDRLAVASTALVAGIDLFAPRSIAGGLIAAVAAFAVAARMAGWQTLRTWREPLVWSLHAGQAWVAIGLLLVAAGDLGGTVPPTAGLHALTTGAMGSMILAVTTRVSLGHTGRPLVLPKGALGTYALVHTGALIRVCAALEPSAFQGSLLPIGGLLWAGAFGLFAITYGAILIRPRIDGEDG